MTAISNWHEHLFPLLLQCELIVNFFIYQSLGCQQVSLSCQLKYSSARLICPHREKFFFCFQINPALWFGEKNFFRPVLWNFFMRYFNFEQKVFKFFLVYKTADRNFLALKIFWNNTSTQLETYSSFFILRVL